ncbi:cell division protein ZipA [Atopomonas sediminilitoris]|uniref:cell division protein ZipA n=1 Tax=Atopomonas sediminilitoris TaxID=2919919 RepID=UPI001F4E6E80|nr:cell division protein ZipA [Atopomonas sediminilitoris]MCJ8167902.1 cell division protein ZipA [Atopomonas sediminilitoris]
MDFGLREWLMVIGLVVIAGILFDGWRRMRGGRNKLRFNLDHSAADLPEVGDAELLGPARTRRDPIEPELDEDHLPALRAGREEPHQGDLKLDEPVPVLMNSVDDSSDETDAPAAKEKTLADLPPVEEVLVINVISRDEEGFKGPELLQNILESGLRFGEMDIFHRHESMAGHGDVLFSMANGVKPGTFDLDDFDHFRTRAVSFFLGMPGPRHPKQAFDVMLAAARKLSSELNGELKDEQRSVLTAQTIEHYRLRIMEFERRKLSPKR